ncbi:MAG: AbrB/MazE/SpoVT family DNA-binding domain-containing protein [Chloroflexi bacterium]|nr:AbrB/MazE/SpoVT family DNA-binding domain-containing protein [Chloroflexota bacterium]
MKTRITSKGQVTVPKHVRQRLGLQPGDEIEFVESDGAFRLEKRVPASPFERYRGFLTHLAGQDPDGILAEMRGE